jgi:hypothetical protein
MIPASSPARRLLVARLASALGGGAFGLALAGCSATSAPPAGEPTGAGTTAAEVQKSCAIKPPAACPDASPGYASVEPILQKSCVPCHPGNGDQWALTDYDHVAAWSDAIAQDLVDCTMPPLDGGIGITASERLSLLVWSSCGAAR